MIQGFITADTAIDADSLGCILFTESKFSPALLLPLTVLVALVI